MEAGALRERFAFSKRAAVDDGLGNEQGEWLIQFTVWAKRLTLKGGETVLANRLAGRAPAIITIRSSTQTREITADWRCVDARSGEEFNIRAVQPGPKRDVIELLVETGVAV